MRRAVFLNAFLWIFISATAQNLRSVKIIPIDSAWAGNSINAVIFRKNSLVSFQNTQYTAYYDREGWMIVAKRKLGSAKWELKKTNYKGNISDAHNSISIMVDGQGYLHLAWDHHNNPLNYCRSVSPGSLILSEKKAMTGLNEQRVTYPEFCKLPDGNLLFFYRNGESGSGNLILNHYDIATRQWKQIQNNLIDGEGQRNAYWQSCVDRAGVLHLSWVWRESPDVSSNHDLCYARSIDGGKTWMRSSGTKYQLPITATNAEYAFRIPQQSELINQTSMTADDSGNPYIAGYWRDTGNSVPQYHVVFRQDNKWHNLNTGFRKTAFSLSGAGTKRIPIARPQVLVWKSDALLTVALIFRDEERGSKVSVAVCRDITKPAWNVVDLSKMTVGMWEPSYDTELWKNKKIMSLFVQKVEQVDGEGRASVPATMVNVLEWDPRKR